MSLFSRQIKKIEECTIDHLVLQKPWKKITFALSTRGQTRKKNWCAGTISKCLSKILKASPLSKIAKSKLEFWNEKIVKNTLPKAKEVKILL